MKLQYKRADMNLSSLMIGDSASRFSSWCEYQQNGIIACDHFEDGFADRLLIYEHVMIGILITINE